MRNRVNFAVNPRRMCLRQRVTVVSVNFVPSKSQEPPAPVVKVEALPCIYVAFDKNLLLLR